MLLGIDISSRKVGFSILSNQPKILYSDILKLSSSISLEERAWLFRDKIYQIQKDFPKIANVLVEEPFVSGGKNPKTVAMLNRFNGMCCFVLFDLFNKLPIMVNPRAARSKLGIKLPRKAKTKEKKKVIIDFVYERFKNTDTPFHYEMTRQGNPLPGTCDRADSIVLCLSNLK